MQTFQEWLITEKKGVNYSFSSVLFLFPSDDAKYVLDWSKKHVPDSVLYEDDDGGKGREDETHVTILYGLHTNNPKSVQEVVSGWEPFEITLGEISKFSSGEYDVIKIGISGDKLYSANSDLSELKHTTSFKDYKPHCTIAYVKKGSCDDLLGDKYFSGRKILANKVVFSPAKGKRKHISLSK